MPPRTIPAERLMRRLGFDRSGFHRENVGIAGEWGSELVCAMLEDEWQNRNTGERTPS